MNDVERINDIAEALGHFAASFVADHGVKKHLLERHLARELSTNCDHTHTHTHIHTHTISNKSNNNSPSKRYTSSQSIAIRATQKNKMSEPVSITFNG